MISCDECKQLIAIFSRDFGIESTFVNLQDSLETRNFKRFLFKMLFVETIPNNPKCRKFVLKKMEFEYYPSIDRSENAKPTSMDEGFEVVKSKIAEGKPVSISSICAARHQNSKECATHCLVAVGTRQVMSRNGEVIDLIQVHNSWGQGWQDRYHGGWVRLDLLKSLMTSSDDPNALKPAASKRKLYAHTFSWAD